MAKFRRKLEIWYLSDVFGWRIINWWVISLLNLRIWRSWNSCRTIRMASKQLFRKKYVNWVSILSCGESQEMTAGIEAGVNDPLFPNGPALNYPLFGKKGLTQSWPGGECFCFNPSSREWSKWKLHWQTRSVSKSTDKNTFIPSLYLRVNVVHN